MEHHITKLLFDMAYLAIESDDQAVLSLLAFDNVHLQQNPVYITCLRLATSTICLEGWERMAVAPYALVAMRYQQPS